uniref:Proline racemase n=1 Tax=Arcella intermedia TaxID=1963864 RepID=A0A6B2L8J6_9EUKA
MPPLKGETIYEKRKYVMQNLDQIRKVLIQEPRGYPCQNANLIVPPSSPGAPVGVIFMEQNKIYPLMSGHNLICVATALLETDVIQMESPTTTFDVETPGGIVKVVATCTHSKAEKITITNVPSFVEALDVVVDVPQLGKVKVDIVFGGMWYAVVNAADVGLEINPKHAKKIARLGEMIKRATREQHPVNHPLLDYPGVDILVFRGPPSGKNEAHAANAVVMSNTDFDWKDPDTWSGMIDRSPCGTGTSAVMAAMWARGEIKLNQEFVHEGILGTTFRGKLVEQTEVAGKAAVVPEISGSAWITQHCMVKIHTSDPLQEGYTLGDIWG